MIVSMYMKVVNSFINIAEVYPCIFPKSFVKVSRVIKHYIHFIYQLNMDIFDGVDFKHHCEVTTDPWTREYYSVDSSHHQIYPEAVCFPKCKEDIKEILHLASRKNLSVSSRGA